MHQQAFTALTTEMRTLLVVQTLAVVSLFLTAGSVAATCPDEYIYTDQPPEAITCNPFLEHVVMLDCTLTGPEDIEVRWYYSPEFSITSVFDDSTVYLSNTSKHLQFVHSDDNEVGLSLTIKNLTDDDVGSYWCQPFATDSSFYLSPSSFVSIREEEFYQGIPFSCFPRPLRNANSGCATVQNFPDPITPTPSSSYSFASSMSSVHTVSLFQLGTTITSPGSQTELSSKLSGPSFTTSTSTVPTPDPPSARPQFTTSEIVLYGVLGLVGFLAIVCCLLFVIICRLCRKRSQKIGLEGYDDKDSGFETLSRGHMDPLQNSSFPQFKYHRDPPHYHPDISMQIQTNTQSPHNSGDYAEIGPALVTLRSQSSGLHTMHDYSEIPPFTTIHSQTLSASNALFSSEQEPQPYLVAERENPYDVLVLPPVRQDTQDSEKIEETKTEDEDEMEEDEEEEVITSGTCASPNGNTLGTHNYDFLEEPETTRFSINGLVENSLLTPPQSPHNYHMLEKDGTPSPTDTVHLEGLPLSTSPLETIPEHPYHILDDSVLDSETQGRDTIEKATPGYTDPDILFEEFADFPDSLPGPQDDGSYDKLIGPPHLLQVLEKAPSAIRPRVCDLPEGYSRLAPVSVDNPASCGDQAGILGGQRTLASYCSEGGQPTEMFDDPQYIVSPRSKSILHQTLSEASSTDFTQTFGDESSTDFTQTLSDANSFTTTQEMIQASSSEGNRFLDTADLSKYLGDYERDPSYMVDILRPDFESDRELKQTDTKLPIPHHPHIYQALERGSIEPKQQYESLKPAMLIGKQTVI